MRNVALAALVAGSLLGQPPAAPVRSPEIGADGAVTFRLRAPAATDVLLTGEFLSGSKPFVKGSDGVWSITLGPLAPEIYHYNLVINGVRTIDPGNPQVKTGSTPSTISSILEVPASGAAFYDAKAVPHGQIHTHWYRSKSLNTTRRVTVYTPPGYDRSGRTRYPVLYLFHGANADETAWVRLGRMNLILDNAIAEGRSKPFVVVMPFGYGESPLTARAAGVNNVNLFGRDLIGDVIPLVESHYRVIADREHRAIAGLSMGGFEALQLGLTNMDRFSTVGAFSAGLRKLESQDVYDSLAANPQTVNRKIRLLWIGCGKDDSLFGGIKEFTNFLRSVGIHHSFVVTPGAHTWMVWRRYLNEFAPLLFR